MKERIRRAWCRLAHRDGWNCRTTIWYNDDRLVAGHSQWECNICKFTFNIGEKFPPARFGDFEKPEMAALRWHHWKRQAGYRE